MLDPHTEYESNVTLWREYKKAIKLSTPGSRFYEDALTDLPRVEGRLRELRAQLCIRPDDDDVMCAAVNALLEDGKTIQNFFDIMLNDPFYSDIRFNVMSQNAEYPGKDGKPVRWTDKDEAASMAYIEKAYGMYQKEKHNAALRLLFAAREYNPVVDAIEAIKWDGRERCEQFLHRWGACENSPYVCEVSRLIFAGGIWRIYQPGCKFDDVPILIGTKQGEGKSSLIRWLALRDEWYGEVSQFDGQPAIEQLYGKWICEISELLALSRTKEVEASKAYITRAVDSYRKPYDRNTIDLPRRCIFIGTTNNAQPLRDVYNRRYYPVTMHTKGYDLFDNEALCREYIAQCWAEAREKYRAHDKSMQNFAKRELIDVYREKQDEARQDDWREGAIEKYLATKAGGDYVCVRELYKNALYPGADKEPSVVDSKDIGMIMGRMDEWEKTERHYFAEYGQQRSWRKTTLDNGQTQLPF